ncbi:hypothetical protein MKJ04_15330 [Pontibacter sp. E15-1]|uniref:hypothetical protein n=1 Tax=Pontibacter sp. E15-1 TaxID=2919918 RepID=UPI001F4F33D4|nr:hypothetical protein [Pontibacter sp. E15-1]MCJ8166219.1 hypothetical protein [Pontibacter sp. E15-1]
MYKRILFVPVLTLALLASCTTPEGLRDFDSEGWKADTYACEGKRSELVGAFEKIRKELYGKKEYVLRNLLGKPDSEELLERNQRIYYYYLEPGAQCKDRSRMSDANRVEVRINALGKVSEVTYHQPYNAAKPD